jgi:putative transposase
MARLPRLALAGLPHYVAQAAVHGQALAHDDIDRRALRQALHDAAARHGVAVWGYALLPQALHLVLCPAEADGLGHVMQTLGRRYVPQFNRRHGRSGALWAGRYRAAVVEPGDWLLAALLRVDRLGLQAPGGGAWSSAAQHLGQGRDPGLSEPPELWALGNTPFERESAWRQRLEQGPDPAVEATLARAVHGTWVAGSDAFQARAEAASGRPAAPRAPGRPRRAADDPAGRRVL